MKKLFLVGVILVLFSGFVSGDTGGVNDCVVTNDASCPAGYSVFLWLSNETNAHVSKVGFEDNGDYKLCCDSSLSGQGFSPLKVYSDDNSHVAYYSKGTDSAFTFSSDYECSFFSGVSPADVFCVLRLNTVENSHVESCTAQSGFYPVILACFEEGSVEEEDLFCTDINENAFCDDPGCSSGQSETIYEDATDCGNAQVCHFCFVPDPVDYCSVEEFEDECDASDDSACVGVEICDLSTCKCDDPQEEPDEPGFCEGTYTLGGDCLVCEGNGDGVECGFSDGYFEQTIYHYELSINDCEGHGLLLCLDDVSNCIWTDTSYGYCFLNVDEDVPFFDYFSIVFALILITSYYVYDRKRKGL
jgi:hypothetical protein